MFRTDEIIKASDFVESFATITWGAPGALLVTRRVGDNFVFIKPVNQSLIKLTLE